MLAKGLDWEGNSYTGILKPTVLCDSVNQPASDWSFLPQHPILFRDWGACPPAPSNYVTDITLEKASTWFIVAFTVERCVVVRFPLLKLRLCTPRNAGLWCGSLLVLAFVMNIDLFFMDANVVSNDVRWGLHCTVPLP